MRRVNPIMLAMALKSPANGKAISIIETMGPREGKGRHTNACIAVRGLDSGLSCFCPALAEGLIDLEEIISNYEKQEDSGGIDSDELLEESSEGNTQQDKKEDEEEDEEVLDPNSSIPRIRTAYEAVIAASENLRSIMISLGYTYLKTAHRNEVLKLVEKLILEETKTPKAPEKQFLALTPEVARNIRVAYVGSAKSKGQVGAKLENLGVRLVDIGVPERPVPYIDVIVINYSKELTASVGESYIKAYPTKFIVQIYDTSIPLIAKKIIKAMKAYLRKKVKGHRV